MVKEYFPDDRIHTIEIQQLIDMAAENGGGVIVVPRGTYVTGSLYFKQGVHLYVMAGGVDGFTMFGPGTIDGNGLRSWKSFWLRRAWNPQCTNKDEQRPRLVFISNSKNVLLADLNLINSHFWTTHIYKSAANVIIFLM